MPNSHPNTWSCPVLGLAYVLHVDYIWNFHLKAQRLLKFCFSSASHFFLRTGCHLCGAVAMTSCSRLRLKALKVTLRWYVQNSVHDIVAQSLLRTVKSVVLFLCLGRATSLPFHDEDARQLYFTLHSSY